jgi:hypothetical protein
LVGGLHSRREADLPEQLLGLLQEFMKSEVHGDGGRARTGSLCLGHKKAFPVVFSPQM